MGRIRFYVLTAFVLGLTATSFAFADKPPSHDRVEIVTDQKAGAVHIVIDGKTVMNVDAQGVHVTGNIDYSGFITDTGTGEAPAKEAQP